MKKLVLIFILAIIWVSTPCASDWKRFPISNKNPIFKLNKTFVSRQSCFGICCDDPSECVVIGDQNQHVSITLDFKHNLARNSSPYRIDIIFYDRNDFELESRHIYANENGYHEFNGWWTKNGYEVHGSVIKYAMIRTDPKDDYYVIPKHSEVNSAGRFQCLKGFTWRNKRCEAKPRCKGSYENYFSKDDKERYDVSTNTCVSLPPHSSWVNTGYLSGDNVTAFVRCDIPFNAHWETSNGCSFECDEGFERVLYLGKFDCRPIKECGSGYFKDSFSGKCIRFF